MLFDLLKTRIRRQFEPVGSALGAAGLTPNVATIVGFTLNAGVAGVLAAGHETIGGLLLVPVAAFDMLDGAIARATQRTSTFGAFLDSTLDRYAEATIFLGLLASYTQRADLLVNVAIFLAIVGSMMVSYTRARAEGLGLRCEVGLLPRPERIIVLALGLVFGLTVPVLCFLALLTNFTALQRIWHVWKLTSGEGRSGRV